MNISTRRSAYLFEPSGVSAFLASVMSHAIEGLLGSRVFTIFGGREGTCEAADNGMIANPTDITIVTYFLLSIEVTGNHSNGSTDGNNSQEIF
jgi:hypothetical protein